MTGEQLLLSSRSRTAEVVSSILSCEVTSFSAGCFVNQRIGSGAQQMVQDFEVIQDIDRVALKCSPERIFQPQAHARMGQNQAIRASVSFKLSSYQDIKFTSLASQHPSPLQQPVLRSALVGPADHGLHSGQWPGSAWVRPSGRGRFSRNSQATQPKI